MKNTKKMILPTKLLTKIYLTILFLVCASISNAQESKDVALGGPTLGNYSAVSVLIGSNSVVTPSAAPTSAARTTARASSGFKGVLTVNPSSGQVRITNAQPASSFTITVTAVDIGGLTASKTFSLTVQNVAAGCSSYTNASFTRSSGSPFGTGADPTQPSVGDFNNDGRQDVVVANFSSNSATVLMGNGNGNFAAGVNFPTGSSPEFLTVNDFNGDGNADFVVANVNSANLSIYLGDGAGGFTGSAVGSGGTQPRFVVAEDFDGNGTIDLAVANTLSNNVVIFNGDGAGGFSVSAAIAVAAQPFGLVKGDFNGDTFIDLAVSAFGGSITILQGNGAGVFAAGAPVSQPGELNFLESGDFNNDGILDLITDNGNNSFVSFSLGNGIGGFTGSSVSLGSSTFGIAAADFDGDGDDDFIASQIFASNIFLQMSNGDGTFTNAGTIGGFNSLSGHGIGDFNGDQRLDFVAAESNRISSLQGCIFAITTASLPNGNVSVSYSQNITTQGGNPSFSYSAMNLPPGLGINPSTGVISGTPTMGGTFSATINATDSTALALNDSNDSMKNLSPSANLTTSKIFQIVISAAPTAANVSISGKVLTAGGNGIRNVKVSITLPSGEVRIAQTGTFGFYGFEDLPAGETYILSIASKRYTFSNPTRIITLNDELTGEDFIADGN